MKRPSVWLRSGRARKEGSSSAGARRDKAEHTDGDEKCGIRVGSEGETRQAGGHACAELRKWGQCCLFLGEGERATFIGWVRKHEAQVNYGSKEVEKGVNE
jgi:hypothetical protein